MCSFREGGETEGETEGEREAFFLFCPSEEFWSLTLTFTHAQSHTVTATWSVHEQRCIDLLISLIGNR